MSRVDLHTHTTYSDGGAPVAALLEAAKARGISTLAITDHETARGSREGQTLAREMGLDLIPAIEITAHWHGYTGHGGGPDIDILGYFIDLGSLRLAQHEAAAFAALSNRAVRVGQAVGLELGEILAENPHFPGYLSLVNALLRKGSARSGAEAAARIEASWQAEGMPLSIEGAVRLVHDLGGVAVLAHPSIIHRRDNGELLSERGLADLVEMGLDGVEVLHYRLSEQQRHYFGLLARMFRLPITGGSDEHGGPKVFRRLGQEEVTPEMLGVLRQLAEERRGGR